LLARIWWYVFKVENNKTVIRDDSPFTEAINKGVLIIVPENNLSSSTLHSENRYWHQAGNRTYDVSFYLEVTVRAVAAF
jgi:hypothetical protein